MGDTATAPTFTHSYKSRRLPSGNYAVLDVPIFLETEKYSQEWLEQACDVAKKRYEVDGYLPPVHVSHHDDEGKAIAENRGAGMMRAVKVEPTPVVMADGSVESRAAYFVDLVEVPPDVFREMKALKLPYRSAEILRPKGAPELSSLALTDTEVPFHRLPVLNVEAPVERYSFRHAGQIEDEMADPKKDEAPKTPPAAPGKVEKFSDGAFPPEKKKDDEGGSGEKKPEAGEEKKPAGGGGSGLNSHATTILKSILMQVQALIDGHAEHTPKPAPQPAPQEDPMSAQPPAPKPAQGAVAEAPDPRMQPFTGAKPGEKVEQFSDAAIEALAKANAKASKATRAATLTDEQRITGAVERFSAKNLLVDADEFKGQIAEIGLKGEQIDKYAAAYEKHLEPAPPRPGEGRSIVGGGKSAAAAGEVERFFAENTDLKAFKDESPEIQRFSMKTAEAWDASEKLRDIFSGTRAEYVAAEVSRVKRESRKK